MLLFFAVASFGRIMYVIGYRFIHDGCTEDAVMKRAKTLISFLLCLMLLCHVATVQANELKITDGADVLEESIQFPFPAQTNELAVNIRAGASTKSEKVGRLERGTQLTVIGAEVGSDGDLFYRVTFGENGIGYIRSDLLIEAEIPELRDSNHAASTANAVRLIGNVKSHKYHEPGCRSLPAEKNRIYFESADEAEEQGYVHCQNCD